MKGQVWRELPEPRAVSGAEASLLAALATASEVEELTTQATRCEVTAVCRCGCPSVRLHTDGPLVPKDTISRLSHVGRDDYLSVESTARVGGRPIQVCLHVLGGRVQELEVFAGEGVTVELPPAAGLRAVRVG